MISSLLSVAVFEQRSIEEISIVDGHNQIFSYFSKPYEPFCKENLSFLLKVLSNLNYEGGLHTLLTDQVIH